MDQNSLFNKDTRIFAFDDSPFSRNDEYTSLIGVIMRKDLYLESILKEKIRVDGLDVTEKILKAIKKKGSGVRVILVQGTTFGGFNILDMGSLFRETGICVINVVDHEPDLDAIKNALRKHFPDWQSRFKIFKKDFTKLGSLYLQTEGINEETAYKFIGQITVNGVIPEPLRIADIIASIS